MALAQMWPSVRRQSSLVAMAAATCTTLPVANNFWHRPRMFATASSPPSTFSDSHPTHAPFSAEASPTRVQSEKSTTSTDECPYGYPLYRLRILFIRHGESRNNILYAQSPSHYQKHRFADPDLTEDGVEQATACGRYLSSGGKNSLLSNDFNPIMKNVDAIYVSPMLRTLQTAQPICEALRIPPQVWTDIYESSGLHMDGVGQPGLNKLDMLEKFPTYILPKDVTERGWYAVEKNKETRVMSILRVLRVAETLFRMAAECYRERKSRTIAIVSHGDFKDMVIQALLGLEIPTTTKRRFLSYNTAISVVDVDASFAIEEQTGGNGENILEEKHATVLLQNFVGHLPPSLITHEGLGIV